MDVADKLEEPPLNRHRLTVAQYHRMGETGVLAPDARVELIEGDVIDMAPMGTSHWFVTSRLNVLLVEAVARSAVAVCQLPIRLDPYCEPVPDFAILKAPADAYRDRLPTGSDALLVIEVSDSTALYDLRTKARLYATHGVAAYWVLEIATRALHRFDAPRGTVYTGHEVLREPGIVALPGLEDCRVDLSWLAFSLTTN